MKERLDVLLVKRNLANSREKAKAVIMSGHVYVEGQKEDKAGTMFADTVSIEVKGNVFSMTCKFEDSSMIVDGIAEALEQGLDASASQFETQAAEFDEAVGQSGACTVAVRYTDPDDKVLAEREFKAQ